MGANSTTGKSQSSDDNRSTEKGDMMFSKEILLQLYKIIKARALFLTPLK